MAARLPGNLDGIAVDNRFQRREGGRIIGRPANNSNSGSNTQTTGQSNDKVEEGGARKIAYLKSGYHVKNHIFPYYKFITRSDDLQFDNKAGSHSICHTYLTALNHQDANNEALMREIWDAHKESIPMALNGQRNSTTKSIRDTTFESEIADRNCLYYTVSQPPSNPSLPTNRTLQVFPG